MRTIGRYEILLEIGRGAMGIVYLAEDPKIDRLVALKCLRPQLVDPEGKNRLRFQQEVVALGRLIHPNIVSIFDAGEDHATGEAYIVMEYVEGTSLAQLLKKEETFSLDQVRSIGIQICNALHFAHSKGIVHRDIKPANILLSPDCKTIKVTDFGIARLDDGTDGATDQLLGTPQYMSPEQCERAVIDGRSDLFAVGSLLYELLTRQKAFPGENLKVIMHHVLTENPLPPAMVFPAIPRGLSRIVMKAIEKDPDDRFSSGKEMSEALRTTGIVAPLPGDGATLVLPTGQEKNPPPKTDRRRGRRLAWTLATGTLLGMISFLVWLAAGPLPPPERLAQPPARQGKVFFSTEPSGAEIRMDGEKKGLSPLSLSLPAGSYDLTVAKPGHHPVEATVHVLAGEEIPIELKLSEEERLP